MLLSSKRSRKAPFLYSQMTISSYFRITRLVLALASLIVTTLPSVAQAVSVSTTTTVETLEVTEDDKEEPKQTVLRLHKTTMTFYTSSADETDSTPTISASGMDVFDGMVASNRYPFGTKLRFPHLFGDKIFEVQDRMNPRYFNRMDIWVTSKREARQLGIKRSVQVEVLEMGNGERYWAKRAKAAMARAS